MCQAYQQLLLDMRQAYQQLLLNIRQAYQQLLLDEDSQQYVVINTLN